MYIHTIYLHDSLKAQGSHRFLNLHANTKFTNQEGLEDVSMLELMQPC